MDRGSPETRARLRVDTSDVVDLVVSGVVRLGRDRRDRLVSGEGGIRHR